LLLYDVQYFLKEHHSRCPAESSKSLTQRTPMFRQGATTARGEAYDGFGVVTRRSGPRTVAGAIEVRDQKELLEALGAELKRCYSHRTPNAPADA